MFIIPAHQFSNNNESSCSIVKPCDSVEINTLPPNDNELRSGEAIASTESFDSVKSIIAQAHLCSIRIYKTGADPLINKIRYIVLAITAAEVYVFDMKALGQAVINLLADLLADETVIKILHDAKADLSFCMQALGRMPVINIFDVMIASQLVNAGLFEIIGEKEDGAIKERQVEHSFQEIACCHLGQSPESSNFVVDWHSDLSEIGLARMAKETALLLPLHKIFAKLLHENDLNDAAELEFKCIPAVTEIEINGIAFDANRARQEVAVLKAQTGEIMSAIQNEIRSHHLASARWTGKKRFNPNSDYDVKAYLVLQGYELKHVDSDTLLELNSTGCLMAGLIVSYRNGYRQLSLINEWLDAQHAFDDRVHGSLRQLNNKNTGRFSSYKPNLQQIPVQLRKLFVAPAGNSLISADYSAVELRIMAKVSQDQKMIHTFQSGLDPHAMTAAALSGKPIGDIGKHSIERQAAKAINFGLIYGCGAKRLVASAKEMFDVDMTLRQAENAKSKFFKLYQGVYKYHRARCDPLKMKIKYAFHSISQGFQAMVLTGTRSLSGRLRIWPDYNEKSCATFTALANTPIQGTGADIIKEAMAGVYEQLLKRKWNKVKFILTVHDELILEAPQDLSAHVLEMLTEEMTKAGQKYLAPLPVSVEGKISQDLTGDQSDT